MNASEHRFGFEPDFLAWYERWLDDERDAWPVREPMRRPGWTSPAVSEALIEGTLPLDA